MSEITIIFQIFILVMSVVIHEISHGYTAEILGDPTPRLQGRLTLNPLRHLEFFGSFIVPLITTLAGFTFGWAKPVQWNPYNVSNKKWGELIISIAGPASNLFIAILFGLIIRFFAGTVTVTFINISVYIVIINLMLAIFNMIPLPPLDGSKILFALLPPNMLHVREVIEKYSIFFFLLLVLFFWRFVEPVVPFLFKVITGVNL